MSDVINTTLEYDDDLADAEKPPLFPEGVWPATIISAEVTFSQSGNRMIKVGTKIDTSDYPADYPAHVEPEGKKLTRWQMATGNGRDRWEVKKLLQSFGITLGSKIDVSPLVGQECRIEVKHGKNNQTGDLMENVNSILPATD